MWVFEIQAQGQHEPFNSQLSFTFGSMGHACLGLTQSPSLNCPFPQQSWVVKPHTAHLQNQIQIHPETYLDFDASWIGLSLSNMG